MAQKIRVAFWHNVFAPYRVPLFQQLAACPELDLTVYYGSLKDRYRTWPVDFGSGYGFLLLPSISIPGYPYKFNYTLFTTLIRQNYDLLIAVENELGAQLTYLAAKWQRKPFILWASEMKYQIVRDKREYTLPGCLKKIPPYLARQCRRILFSPLSGASHYIKRHADAYLVAGRKTEEYLRALGVRKPIFRHGNTIDTVTLRRQLQAQDRLALKRALGIEGKKVILSVSYLQKRKGIQYLIEAFLRLPRQDAVLVIVGDGEYKAELLKFVPAGRTDILFLGHHEDPAPYYALADIFVMASFSDPWGLTVNEAMVAGLPVITTTNVGAQELIQGNGFLIPPRNSRALQTALEKLLDDEQLRQQMGQRSLEVIQPYTIEHAAEVCRQAIQAVANRPNSYA